MWNSVKTPFVAATAAASFRYAVISPRLFPLSLIFLRKRKARILIHLSNKISILKSRALIIASNWNREMQKFARRTRGRHLQSILKVLHSSGLIRSPSQLLIIQPITKSSRMSRHPFIPPSASLTSSGLKEPKTERRTEGRQIATESLQTLDQ